MAISDIDKEAIKRYATEQALLRPFKKVLENWSVDFVSARQRSVHALDLVATGDLSQNWGIQVRAHNDGRVLADFSFPEYGRYFDMRRINRLRRPPVSQIEEWVKDKISQGRIKYSTLADSRGLAMTDPRVIRDIAWRITHPAKFIHNRRRWYNKGKEASLHELYEQLAEVAREVVIQSMKSDVEAQTTNQ